jgi:hypothetical protein
LQHTNHLFNLEIKQWVFYTIFHIKKNKCWKSFKIVRKLLFIILSIHILKLEISGCDNADKVAAVSAWPQPRSARGLRGFMGLAGYDRKFIRDFGLIAAPLTRLLR